MSFEKLALHPFTMRAIKEMGFTTPSPIQRESIPMLKKGIDLIGQAMTGSGKTAAFGIHIIEHIDRRHHKPQALILTPTRELAVQVTQEIRNLSKYHQLSIVTIYGGASINKQMDELHRGANVVVGTPGRVLDMIDRRALHLEDVKIAVLDEADRMLDMGFIDDVRKILDWTSRDRQTMLFSATMPKEIRDLSHRYMKDPQSLTVSTDAVPIDKIKQTFVLVERKKKFPMLLTIIRTKHPKLALIFARTKFGADKLAHQLSRNGVQAQAIHGDLSQNNRDRTMKAFKAGQIRFLVATDLASRGIDVTGITHIINFDLPDEPATYSHRVGRTARAGAEGQAITLVLPEQYKEFSDVQRINGQRIEREHLQGEVQGEWFTDRKETAHHTHAYRYKFGQKYDNDFTN